MRPTTPNCPIRRTLATARWAFRFQVRKAAGLAQVGPAAQHRIDNILGEIDSLALQGPAVVDKFLADRQADDEAGRHLQIRFLKGSDRFARGSVWMIPKTEAEALIRTLQAVPDNSIPLRPCTNWGLCRDLKRAARVHRCES